MSNCGNAQISLGTKIAKRQINRITKYNAFYTYFEKDDQKLFFVPMIHVNKPEFYEKRKSTIDSLRNEGYIFFYEGIQLELESKEETELYANSTAIDTARAKYETASRLCAQSYINCVTK